MTRPTAALILLTALSLSVGWGIRGNFGHEFGAMIPGALAALAGVLLAGRADWWRRGASFAFFGALGWSFGGSISYMQVIAYTHSGHSGSVLYGFACLFVIGFLWAAMGGAGTALPACLTHERLTELFPPIAAVFVAWALQDGLVSWFSAVDPAFRQADPLYWHDTDWLGALVAIVAVGLFALLRRRLDSGSSLILHMAVGWWVGFLLLVVLLGWRMTPPRGDNWAGCVGMVGGMWFYLRRHGLIEVLNASLVSGFIGGFGFATATMLKLVEVRSGAQTNWHSILEQTYGFINGLGIAVALLMLRRRAPQVAEGPAGRRGTEGFAVAFVLIGITFLNLRKNPGMWVKSGTMPPVLLGLSADAWFNLAYLALAFVAIAAIRHHYLHPLALVPATDAGKAQLLYLVFLWWMVAGNFERAIVSFAPQRLVTEGVIHLHALLCSLLVLLCLPLQLDFATALDAARRRITARIVTVGLVGTVLSVGADWVIVRSIYGDQFAGHAGRHIRFGPDATATRQTPPADKPHP